MADARIAVTYFGQNRILLRGIGGVAGRVGEGWRGFLCPLLALPFGVFAHGNVCLCVCCLRKVMVGGMTDILPLH